VRIGPSIGIPGDAAAITASISPASLPGLVLWVRGDLGGQTAGQWDDMSGQGHHLVQATGSLQPSIIASGLNGRPTRRFDGSDDFMATAPFTLNQPETLLMVFKIIVYGSSTVHDIAADGNAAGSMVVGTLDNASTAISAGVSFSAATPVPSGTFVRFGAIYNSTSSAIRLSGAELATGNAGTNNAGGFTLGALANGTRSYNIEVFEVALYNRALTAPELARIELYQAAMGAS
jgi:hypothetical protein